MLKPNVVNSNPPWVTTNPEVIRGTIRAAKARGAATVLVAEAGAMPGRTLQSMQTLGIVQVCAEEGAEAVALDDTTTAPQTPSGAGGWPNGIPIFQTVHDADYVINMPCLKTHALPGWLTSPQDFAYAQQGVGEHAGIMAWRNV